MDDHDDDPSSASYRWEGSMQRSWDQVVEDEHGRLTATNTVLDAQHDRKRAKMSREERVTESIRRGLIRYMVVVIDSSLSATEKDFRPSRLQATKDGLVKFVSDFYDQNPISQLAFAVTRDRTAEKISELSGSKKGHLKPLQDLSRCEGVASLQVFLFPPFFSSLFYLSCSISFSLSLSHIHTLTHIHTYLITNMY
jgi:transcription initiation factor TFIIH subunit 2